MRGAARLRSRRRARGAARIGSTLAAIVAFGVAACMLAPGCTDRPAAPARTNPFDPANPDAVADPIAVRAEVAGRAVEISWSAVEIAGRSGYRVYRRTPSDTAFVALETVGPGETSARDAAPPRDAVVAYLVTVLSAAGVEADRAALVPDSVDVPPLLVINEEGSGLDTTSVRAVTVHFYSSRAESIYLADTLDAQNAVGLRDPVPFAPDSAGYPWFLPEGGGPGARKLVYGTIRRSDGGVSPVASDAISVAPIGLEMLVDGRSDSLVTTGRRAVAVAIVEAAGAESLQATFDSAFAGAWVPFAAAFSESIPAPGRRTLRVRVKNDFAIEDTVVATVIGDTLLAARILLNAGAAQTSLPTVNVHAAGGAALTICLANEQAPTCEADSFRALDGVFEGWALPDSMRGRLATVFARLANDWDTTDVLEDQIFFVDTLAAP